MTCTLKRELSQKNRLIGCVSDSVQEEGVQNSKKFGDDPTTVLWSLPLLFITVYDATNVHSFTPARPPAT